MNKAIVLEAESVSYGSPLDEKCFFDWLSQIDGIIDLTAEHRSVFITVEKKSSNDALLRELIAIFHRYNINMKQLAQFEDERNRSWFRNSKAYWYFDVF